MFGLQMGRMGRSSSGRTLAAQIKAMYAAGEQGAWYDPSDWSTLYQDSAGTMPVTAVGQPVGLMLDKRLGVVPGLELVTNGDFSTGANNYTTFSAQTAVIQNGRIEITTSATGNNGWFAVPATGGKAYEISFTHVGGTIPALTYHLRDQTGAIYANNTSYALNTTTTIRTYLPTGATELRLGLVRDTAIGTAFFDNISVRELPGNHATQPTVPNRLIYQTTPARLVSDGIDDSHVTTFATALGSNCTVIRSVPGVGAQILTAQTIGTTYTNTTTHSGLLIINRALTASEIASVTKWANQKAGV